MLDQILDHVDKEMRVLLDAPLLFFAALAVTSTFIWRVFEWRYAAKNDLIELYKAKLDGATPEEARARIEKLEATIKRTVGSEWKPLGDREVDALRKALEPIERRLYT